MPSSFQRPKGIQKLGFGTWQFGGDNRVNGMPAGWGHVDQDRAVEAVHFALSCGINFFDTADTYGRGQSEQVLGRAFSSYGGMEVPLVCTKFGNEELADGTFGKNYSADYLRRCVESSLKRLRIDSLEMILLHSPDDGFDWDSYNIDPFEALIEEGLIKRYGVSSRSVYGARRVAEAGFGSVIEVTYNLLDRRPEDLLFGQPFSDNYSFIARVPLASGFINSALLKADPEFEKDDYRSTMNPRDLAWLIENVRRLDFLEQEEGGIAVSALRYLLANDSVDYVIPGMRSTERIVSNSRAVALGPLYSTLIERIRDSVPDVPDWWKPRTS